MKLLSFKGAFKSLLGCDITLSAKTPLTCLIGLNGAGKSNIVQAMGFGAACVRGNVDEYIKERIWNIEQLSVREFVAHDEFFALYSDGNITSLRFYCIKKNDDILAWNLIFDNTGKRHPVERFLINTKIVFILKNNELKYNDTTTKIVFNYKGSIIAALNEDFFTETPEIGEFRKFISSLYTFDVLEPARLKTASMLGNNIGSGGGTLAAFYASLSDIAKTHILSQVQSVYPWLHAIHINTLENGAKELQFQEKHDNEIRNVSALHANDGTLRLLSILAELHSDDSVILFDEIENGFNPAVSKQVMDILLNSPKQVIITTHSPDLLQYIPHDVAEDVVKLVYRTQQGTTQCMNFFELPEAKKRLGVLGVGEAFLDVDIASAVAQWEAASVAQKEQD